MPVFTLRLPDEDYEALQAMALIEGRSMAELARESIISTTRNYAQSQRLDERVKAEQKKWEAAVSVLNAAATAGRK